MTWVFEFEAPKPYRLLKTHFFGVHGDGMWWSYDKRKWMENSIVNSSSHAGVKSFKAFKRHLENHPELQGRVVVFCNRYKDCDIIARWEQEKKL